MSLELLEKRILKIKNKWKLDLKAAVKKKSLKITTQ
jgi:hypothetical protein